MFLKMKKPYATMPHRNGRRTMNIPGNIPKSLTGEGQGSRGEILRQKLTLKMQHEKGLMFKVPPWFQENVAGADAMC